MLVRVVLCQLNYHNLIRFIHQFANTTLKAKNSEGGETMLECENKKIQTYFEQKYKIFY